MHKVIGAQATAPLEAVRAQRDGDRVGPGSVATSGGGTLSKGPPHPLEERAHPISSAVLLASELPGLGIPFIPAASRDVHHSLALHGRHHIPHQ